MISPTHLFVLKGKGTSYYMIGVGYDASLALTLPDSPFKLRIFSLLETDRAEAIKEYLHRYFIRYHTNSDWYELPSEAADKLKSLLNDPDNLISESKRFTLSRQASLPNRLWMRLDDLTEKTNSLGQQGKLLGQLSWEALLERIAQNPNLLALIEQELNGKPSPTPYQYQQPIIVRPNETETETLAWLKVDGDRVSVEFPEKRDDFREIVRGMDYTWNKTRWERYLARYSGDAQDRAAELGHQLLANGFCVVFPDESLQDMAVSVTYEPEYRRWVFVRETGKYKGWFQFWWSRQEDCYEEAIKVPASRYSKPNVVVPFEQFAAVVDFAQAHRFRFSQEAFELVGRAKALYESALVVSLEEQAVDWDDMDLNIPSFGWEDENLLDEEED